MDVGNLAQWVGAGGTIAAVIVALFKEELIQWFRHPVLVARVKAEYPYCVKTLRIDKKARYWVRLWIENEGEVRAEQVQVFVAQVFAQHADGTFKPMSRFTPMNLRWSYTGEVYADGISPRMSKLCDLAAIDDPALPLERPAGVSAGQTILCLILEAQPPSRDCLPPGRYQFEINLAARNCKPRPYRIEFNLTGQWSEDESHMLSHGIGLKVL